MRHCYFFPVSCAVLLMLLHKNCFHANAEFTDLINTTCKQCSDKSTSFKYDFCLASLQAIPAGHVVNLQGLALVTLELTLENATATISIIEEILNSGKFDTFSVRCLKDCLELYADSTSTLIDSIVAFLSKQYETTTLLLTAVMEATSTCEEEFKKKEERKSPVTQENNNVFHLSEIAVCTVGLLSTALDSTKPSLF
ncbi:hypothetical protein NMG60_11027493 [Bertholletia excelsa]